VNHVLPNIIKSSKDNKNESARSLVTYKKELADSYRKTNYDDKWIDYQRLYRSRIKDEANYPHMARLFIPYTFSSIETVIPRMVEAIFSSEPIVAVKPYERAYMDKAKIMEVLLNYQLKRMDYFNTFLILAKMCLTYGTCISKVDWRTEHREKRKPELVLDEAGFPVYDSDGVTPKYTKKKNKILFYDDPYIYPVDILKFFIDPKALSIQGAEYCILVTETTMDRLKDMESQGIYSRISEVEDVKGTTTFDRGRERFDNVDKNNPSDNVGGNKEFKSNRVTLYEYWEKDRVITVAEEKVVIRDEENPYWHCQIPFVAGKICPVENEFYGIGIPEMTETLQNELNDVRNQRMDNVTIAMNKMFIATRGSDILKQFPDGVIPTEPGLIILSNEPDGVEQLSMSDVTQSSFADAKEIISNIETTIGIYDYSKGAPGRSRETATGILSLQEAANVRFKLMITEMAKMLGEQSNLMVGLNEQYIDDEKVTRLTNAGLSLKVENIEDVIGRFDYEPVGASLEGLSKYARSEQLLRKRQVMASNPDFIVSKMDKQLLELDNFPDASEYFYSMQQPQQQQGLNPMGANPIMGNAQNVTPGQLPLVAVPGQEAGIQNFPPVTTM